MTTLPFESRTRAALEATAILIAQRPEGECARMLAETIRHIRTEGWPSVREGLDNLLPLVPASKRPRFHMCLQELLP